MPKIIIEIELGNAAFEQPGEIDNVLQQVGSKIAGADYGDAGFIKDSNGNTVGSYELK